MKMKEYFHDRINDPAFLHGVNVDEEGQRIHDLRQSVRDLSMFLPKREIINIVNEELPE